MSKGTLYVLGGGVRVLGKGGRLVKGFGRGQLILTLVLHGL